MIKIYHRNLNLTYTKRNIATWIISFISIHQTYIVRIWITFSASVIDCKIPFSMLSRLLLFSVMLKIVLGRNAPLSSPQMMDIIFEIVLGGTLTSYGTFTWKSNVHIIEYIPGAIVKIKQNNHWNLPVWDHYFVDPSLQVWLWSGQVWDENCAEESYSNVDTIYFPM